MNEPTDNEDLTKRAKEMFDDSVERLDAAALSQLNQGRHAAMRQLENNRGKAEWYRWAPAGGVAAVALVTIMVMRGPEVDNIPAEVVTDFDILLEGESLEMLENLEFYSWMDDAEVDVSDNIG